MAPTTPRDEQDPDLSERLLDTKENESDKATLEEKARAHAEKLAKANEEDHQRSDNQGHADRLLDKETGEG